MNLNEVLEVHVGTLSPITTEIWPLRYETRNWYDNISEVGCVQEYAAHIPFSLITSSKKCTGPATYAEAIARL